MDRLPFGATVSAQGPYVTGVLERVRCSEVQLDRARNGCSGPRARASRRPPSSGPQHAPGWRVLHHGFLSS